MDLTPGAVIGGIELRKELVQRPMTTLWAGLDQAAGRDVWLKIATRRGVAYDDALSERFDLESRAVREINSPHVISVIGAGFSDEGLPYVVYPAVRGRSLSERLAREPRMSLQDIDRLISQTAAGLAAAHAIGIVHRDITPDAIMLEEGSPFSVKIVDFGFAKVIGGKLKNTKLTLHGRLIGTPAYINPERVSAKKVTTHADNWGLAVVAYQALTGELPFGGSQLGIMLVRIVQGGFRKPSYYREGLGPEVDVFFDKALSARSKLRFQTPLELANAFSVAIAASDEDMDWSID